MVELYGLYVHAEWAWGYVEWVGARLIRDRCVWICAVGLCGGGPVCGERLLSAGEKKSLCVR